jgi:catechol 2,3-dioxygenase-like lactoylglutathione lyase family enzyme
VPDLRAGLAFYRDALGHVLVWRAETSAGLRLADSAAEVVIQTERPELEANLSVASGRRCSKAAALLPSYSGYPAHGSAPASAPAWVACGWPPVRL